LFALPQLGRPQHPGLRGRPGLRWQFTKYTQFREDGRKHSRRSREFAVLQPSKCDNWIAPSSKERFMMTSFSPKMTPRSAPRPTGSGTSRPAASPVLSLSKGRSAENCLGRCEYSRTFAGSRHACARRTAAFRAFRVFRRTRSQVPTLTTSAPARATNRAIGTVGGATWTFGLFAV